MPHKTYWARPASRTESAIYQRLAVLSFKPCPICTALLGPRVSAMKDSTKDVKAAVAVRRPFSQLVATKETKRAPGTVIQGHIFHIHKCHTLIDKLSQALI